MLIRYYVELRKTYFKVCQNVQLLERKVVRNLFTKRTGHKTICFLTRFRNSGNITIIELYLNSLNSIKNCI